MERILIAVAIIVDAGCSLSGNVTRPSVSIPDASNPGRAHSDRGPSTGEMRSSHAAKRARDHQKHKWRQRAPHLGACTRAMRHCAYECAILSDESDGHAVMSRARECCSQHVYRSELRCKCIHMARAYAMQEEKYDASNTSTIHNGRGATRAQWRCIPHGRARGSVYSVLAVGGGAGKSRSKCKYYNCYKKKRRGVGGL